MLNRIRLNRIHPSLAAYLPLFAILLLVSGACSNSAETPNSSAEANTSVNTSHPEKETSTSPKPTSHTIEPTAPVSAEHGDADSTAKKTLVCSTTQVADFARNVVGDDWNVICVLGPGQDPHSYRPGADSPLIVGRADLCLENGWHLEGNEWMKTLAKNANKPIVTCVNGIKHLEMDDEGKSVKDPHAWFDPKNAWVYVKNIRDAVSKLDPGNAEQFAKRADLYQHQLRALDAWIKDNVNDIPQGRRMLVTHHDAFGYFCKAYNFRASSPVGWTTADLGGVTLERRQQIIKNIRDLKVKSLFVETTINPKLLNEIADEAGVAIGGELYSDAMGGKGSAGETYIGMMRENVLTIVSALK